MPRAPRRRARRSCHHPLRPPRGNQLSPPPGPPGGIAAERPTCPDTIVHASQHPVGPAIPLPQPATSPQDQDITRVSRTAATEPLPGPQQPSNSRCPAATTPCPQACLTVDRPGVLTPTYTLHGGLSTCRPTPGPGSEQPLGLRHSSQA